MSPTDANTQTDTTVAVRMPQSLRDELQRIADDEHRLLSQQVRLILEEYVARESTA